jgi:hypothetical protein
MATITHSVGRAEGKKVVTVRPPLKKAVTRAVASEERDTTAEPVARADMATIAMRVKGIAVATAPSARGATAVGAAMVTTLAAAEVAAITAVVAVVAERRGT